MQAITSRTTPLQPVSLAALGRNRFVLGAVALAAIASAAAWQWSWLAAIGVTPLLLSLVPCAAMCALGLCLHRMGSGSSRTTDAGLPSAPTNPEQIGTSPDQTINQGETR
jgi:hypothetical protein